MTGSAAGRSAATLPAPVAVSYAPSPDFPLFCLLLMRRLSAFSPLPKLRVAGMVLTVFCLTAQASVYGQSSDDGIDRDCPPAPEKVVAAPPTSLCIELDARESIDSLAGPLTFRWQMGDGQTREGLQFEYCYAAKGRYVIQLDVLDPATGEVRQHEEERVVDFATPPSAAPEPALRFTAPDRAKVGEAVDFGIINTDLPPCLPSTVRFNWNFRDGLLAQGRTAKHTFRRAGTFVVRVALDGSLDAGCLTRQCVTKTIVIEP